MADPSLFKPVLLSVAAAIVTLLLKGAAYFLTGSVGLLSDAAESLINLLAALTAYLSLWYASRPVDESHTYGHDKIEYFSSGLEGVLILVAAGGIAWYAIVRLFSPELPQNLEVGTAISVLASLVNLVVAQILIRQGRKHRSIVLEADGKHLMTDVWTSVGVLLGLGMVYLTHVEVLDPLIALLVSANIVWTGFDLVRRSFNGLMDHALPAKEMNAVRSAIEGVLGPGTHFHALRTRQAGTHRFADFHLLVAGDLPVRRAHDLANRVEQAVRDSVPGIEVTIHIEPIDERASWEDSALLAIENKLPDAPRPDEAAKKNSPPH
jgi:cation diffusion facilitator family transporter